MSRTDDMLAVIVDALELPGDYSLGLDDRISDVPGWDSFGWVEVISALEKFTQTELLIDRIETVQSVGDLITLVDSPKAS